MSTKILGNEELNILRAKTPYSLPDNPSDKGFNARQIKTKFWEGYLLLFNWLKDTQASINNDFATTNSALLNESKRIDVILTYFSNGKANFAVRDRNNNIIDETYELKSEASSKFNQLIADIQSVGGAAGNKITGTQNINADGIQYTITLSNTQNATLSTITQYLPLATTLKAGLLSSSDKEKLNNLESDLTNFLANAKAYTDEKLERTNIVEILGSASHTLSGLLSSEDKKKLDALYALLGEEADADTVVNTINEVLAIFSSYPEGVDIVSQLEKKVNYTDVINTLDSEETSKPLSAKMGKELKTEVDTKAELAYVNEELDKKALKSDILVIDEAVTAQESEITTTQNEGDKLVDEIVGYVDGSPRGVYASLSALQSALPSGAEGVYVTSDNGHWYYYNNGWKDGGVYESPIEVLDTGLNLDWNTTLTWQTAHSVSPTTTTFSRYDNALFIILKIGGTKRYFFKVYKTDSEINFEYYRDQGKFRFIIKSDKTCTVQYLPNVYESDITFASLSTLRGLTTETSLTTSLTLSQCKNIDKLSITTDSNVKRIFTKTVQNDTFSLFAMPHNDGFAQIQITNSKKTIQYFKYDQDISLSYTWESGKSQYVRNKAGNLNTNANYSVTSFIDVKNVKKIIFTSPNTTNTTEQLEGAGFFDENKKFIYGSGIAHRCMSSENTYDLICIDVPKGARYFRADFRTAQKDNFYIKLLDTYDSIENKHLDYTDKSLIVSADTWSGTTPTYETVMALYDSLIGEYDDVILPDDYNDTSSSSGKFTYKYKVSKKIMGKDSSGLYDVYEFTFSPTEYKRSVYWHCVMHGGEEQTTLAMYQLLKHIVDNDDVCKKSPVLSYIRKYVRIYLIPVQNPYGMNNGVYGDINLVNPSRNFPYYWNEYQSTDSEWDKKGTAPFSSQNTRNLLKGYLEHRGEIDFDIDYHTAESSSWKREPMFYYDNTDDYVRPALLRATTQIINQSSLDKQIPLCQETARTLNIFWVNRCLGVPTATIETSPHVYSDVRNSADQLTPLMYNYTCYWTELFNLPKRTHRLNSSLSLIRLTREEYNSLPYRQICNLYILTDENNKKMLGDFDFDSGWIES